MASNGGHGARQIVVASIRVELVCVHVGEDGAETYELAFVDSATGFYGSALEVSPDGKMRVITEEKTNGQ